MTRHAADHTVKAQQHVRRRQGHASPEHSPAGWVPLQDTDTETSTRMTPVISGLVETVDPCDGTSGRVQAVFNTVLGPRVLRDFSEDALSVRLHGLSQDRFPSWCAGPCGCIGKQQVTPGPGP